MPDLTRVMASTAFPVLAEDTWKKSCVADIRQDRVANFAVGAIFLAIASPYGRFQRYGPALRGRRSAPPQSIERRVQYKPTQPEISA
jgi:hypothetical protein